jgi:molybdopterin-guanine dinucleotide biosynthesis protein B
MVPVVSFVGNSGAGKTTILEKTVRELKGRGYRVAVIKHAHHDFQIDYPGKDSWRFSEAGSDVVVISSPAKMAMVEPRSEEPSLDELIALVEGKADIILTEGFRYQGKPQVLVMRAAQSAEASKEEIDPLAIVSDYPFDSAQDRPVDSPVPRFDFDDVARLTDFLLVHLQPSPPSPK